MSHSFNGLDARAHDPSLPLSMSEDVLVSTADTLASSPSPFSVGVYACDGEMDAVTYRPLPLVYVSEEVAADRAHNSPAMPSGWYMPLEKGDAGARFEVRVTVRADGLGRAFGRLMPGADVALVCLKIDGIDVMTGGEKCGTGFAVRTASGVGADMRFQGFVQSTYRTPQSGAATLRSFYFGKPEVVEWGEKDDSGSGGDGIEVVVVSGRSRGQRKESQNHVNSTKFSNVKVNEKDLMKKGTSVSLKRDGKKLVEEHRLTPYAIDPASKREVPTLGIKIFVREKMWLVSRRIIDERGVPLGADAADEARRAMLGDKGVGIGIGNVVDRAAKRVKMEKSLERENKVPEFVDLT